MLCMSRCSTVSLVNSLGENYDSVVTQWKDSLIPTETIEGNNEQVNWLYGAIYLIKIIIMIQMEEVARYG